MQDFLYKYSTIKSRIFLWAKIRYNISYCRIKKDKNLAGSTSKCNTRCLTVSVFQKGCIGGFEPQALSWPPV